MRKTIFTAVAALLSMAATAQITETPEGEMLKNMEWQSKGMYPDYAAQQMHQFVEQGAIAHVVVSGNKMYIKDPITKYKVGAWIEGEISDDGTQVVFHTPQAYTESNGTLFYLTRLVQVGTKLGLGESTDLVFSYEDGKLTQTDGGYLVITNLEGQSAGYLDYNITITPLQEETVTPPADAEMLSYKMDYEGQGGQHSQTVNVAFSGSDVYIANPAGIADSWIKGTLDGDKIVCPNTQFLGADESLGYFVYFKAAEGTIEMVEYPGFGTLPVSTINLTSDEAVTFTYNADDRSFSTEQLFLVNPAKDKVGESFHDYGKSSFTTFTEVAAVPANPAVTSYYDIIEGFGFGIFMIDMPNQDTEGNYINQENMYYNLYLDDTPVATPLGLTDIPYTYTYGDFFQVSGTSHTFKYVNPINEKIGVQTFYKVGDQLNRSDLVWYYIHSEPDAIAAVKDGQAVARTEYFDGAGRMVSPDTKGLLIRRITFADGTQQTTKVMK